MQTSDIFLIMSNCYFVFNAVVPQRLLCFDTLSKDAFFGNVVIDFAEKHNPVVLDNPEWFRVQNCADVYFFLYYYIFTIYVTITNTWFKYKNINLLALGGIFYARGYYYVMLTSHKNLPSGALEQVGSEILYDISTMIVLYNTLTAKQHVTIKIDNKNL